MVPDGRTCLALLFLSVDILHSFGSRSNDVRPGPTSYRPAAISRTPICPSRNARLVSLEAVSWPGPIQRSEALLHFIPLSVAFEQTRRMLLDNYQSEKFTFSFQQNTYPILAPRRQLPQRQAHSDFGIYSAIGRLTQRRW